MLRRLALVAATATIAALTASPAWAGTDDVPINPGNIADGGTLAADFTQGCDIGGGPFPDQDVWVFLLPGNHATSGDFISVTLWFDQNGDGVAEPPITIPDDGGGFLNGGPQTSKAFIALPAGWALLDAKADITGTATSFNLTHTCAATSSSPSPSPSPSASQTGSPSPSPSVSTSPGTSESPSPGTSESPGTSPSAGTSETPSTPASPTPTGVSGGGGGLPTTGVAVTAYTLTGTLLIAAGIFALLAARRRRSHGEG